MVWYGEWVRVRNMMNNHFKANGPCSKCGRLSCTAVWYSIKSREVRCFKCFDAMAEHSAMQMTAYQERRTYQVSKDGIYLSDDGTEFIESGKFK